MNPLWEKTYEGELFRRSKKEQPVDFQYVENELREEIVTSRLFSLVQEKEEQSARLKLVKELKKVLPDVEDRTLFYEVCNDFMDGRRHQMNTGVECTLDDIYDEYHDRISAARSIMSKRHAVIEADLVELLLARELFFSEELTRDLDFVKQSLQEESYVALPKRLEENSLPKGVAILFHGLPGTGKTAAVDMIAKATGRSVYHVDIAASKSCWFGESEKLFKKNFTDYRRMCKSEERKPILLFNEADALFSKRRDVDSGNCAQTENVLQNILLEELEKLDGILIAPTNLSGNRPGVEMLEEWCRGEKLTRKGGNAIGFAC